ncbi:MAG: hypothetical protein R2856_00635 [Caldilineaceae bacterium]
MNRITEKTAFRCLHSTFGGADGFVKSSRCHAAASGTLVASDQCGQNWSSTHGAPYDQVASVRGIQTIMQVTEVGRRIV